MPFRHHSAFSDKHFCLCVLFFIVRLVMLFIDIDICDAIERICSVFCVVMPTCVFAIDLLGWCLLLFIATTIVWRIYLLILTRHSYLCYSFLCIISLFWYDSTLILLIRMIHSDNDIPCSLWLLIRDLYYVYFSPILTSSIMPLSIAVFYSDSPDVLFYRHFRANAIVSVIPDMFTCCCLILAPQTCCLIYCDGDDRDNCLMFYDPTPHIDETTVRYSDIITVWSYILCFNTRYYLQNSERLIPVILLPGNYSPCYTIHIPSVWRFLALLFSIELVHLWHSVWQYPLMTII